MKHNVALKKNVSITIRYMKDLFNNESIYINELNEVKTSLRFRSNIKENLEEALNSELEFGTEHKFLLKNIYVKKDMLYINDVAIVEMNYLGISEVYYALSPIVAYHISIDKDHLQFAWSWSLDKHIQNLSSRVEDVKVVGTDYKTTLKKLMKSYSKKLERNSMYVFEIIEYRGKDKNIWHNENRLLTRESVGYQEDNFDEDIWQALHERR